MNWYDRQQQLNNVTEPYRDIDFTEEELVAVGNAFEPLPMLILKGPDDKFEAALWRYVDEIKGIVEARDEESADLKGPIYGVPWCEVEFGQRSEGWALFIDLEKCVEQTKAAAKRGAYGDGAGYLGPEMPLCYYEIPIEGLEEKYLKDLAKRGLTHTENRWNPKYRNQGHSING